ncbi:Glycosyltransferase [uncultured Thiomicrorhabdus sp.]
MKKSISTTVIQVITSPCGGGAELLVRELAKRLNSDYVVSKAIYFNTTAPCAQGLALESNEIDLNVGYKSFLSIFKLRKIFKEELKKTDKLIVHAHLTWPLLFVPIALMGLKDVKLIFTEHNTYNGRRKYPFFRFFERLIYSSYASIICISKGVQDAFCDWVGEMLCRRTRVISNGARFYSYKERQPPSHIVKFVSVGSLTSQKGFDRTIRALAKMKDLNWQYDILGEGPLRYELEELIEENNVADKVYLRGWIGDVKPFLHEADVQLIPSVWEGFGLVAVEGLSTGLPVIGSNVSGLNEILNKGNGSCFVVANPESISSWVQEINKCLVAINSDLLCVSNDAINVAKEYSIDTMIDKYLIVYEDM